MKGKLVVGVDLGATKLRVALMEWGSIIRRREETTRVEEGPEGVLSQLTALIRAVAGQELSGVVAVGVGSIGPLDQEGRVVGAPHLPFPELPLKKPLEEELDRPIYILNDCNAAAVAESLYGPARGIGDFVYLTLSTGIGAGIYMGGRLQVGKDGNAGEVGCLVIDMEGRLTCGCGRPGHWQAYCAGASIPAYARLVLEGDPGLEGSLLWRLMGGEWRRLTTPDIFAAARQEDRLARRVVEAVGRLNSMGVASVINAYDPALVVVGGGMALANRELVLAPIRRWVGEYAQNRVPPIELTRLGDSNVLLGATAWAYQQLREG